MDVYAPMTRSAVMRVVKSQNTNPEMTVRRLLHKAGYRFRLHRKDLPGKPDLVFPGLRKVVFVHGCFWYQHSGCRHADWPASNTAYWSAKLNRNQARDTRNLAALRDLGWQALVLWECQVRDREALLATLTAFLGPPAAPQKPIEQQALPSP